MSQRNGADDGQTRDRRGGIRGRRSVYPGNGKTGRCDVFEYQISAGKSSVIYEYLAEIRAWSAAGVSLYTGERLLGILMVLNPHRHLEESGVLSMLGATLVARIELRNLQEQQEYDRTHDKLTNLWNREGLSVMARTGRTICSGLWV